MYPEQTTGLNVPERILVSNNPIFLASPGMTAQITAKVTDIAGKQIAVPVKFVARTPNVIAVDQTGNVEALAFGYSEIVVSTMDGAISTSVDVYCVGEHPAMLEPYLTSKIFNPLLVA